LPNETDKSKGQQKPLQRAVVLSVAKGRWEIKESFRIMKNDFHSRRVDLSRNDRIKAHFQTCFIALLVLRILEKNLAINLHATPFPIYCAT